jgi:uncharacterized protein (TIGR02996 family)
MMPAMPKFSDEERALLDAIHDEPHYQSPYLAYADWLDGRGHPMGAYIRLRLAIESWKAGDPVELREVMRKRANELLAVHGKEWSRPVSKEFDYRGFTINGMPYAHERAWADFERADGWLRRMSPRLFLGMLFSCPIDELADRLGHPLVRRVHRIRFYIGDFGVGAAGESKARLIAQASVLKRCFDVSFSVGTFSDVSCSDSPT